MRHQPWRCMRPATSRLATLRTPPTAHLLSAGVTLTAAALVGGSTIRKQGACAVAATTAGVNAPDASGSETTGANFGPPRKFELMGKRALVFGGTSGIGVATSIRLRDAGAEVVAISRSGKMRSEGANVSGIQIVACDVLDQENLVALFSRLEPFDVLISTATGGDRAIGPFLSMDMDAYQRSFAKLWGYANVVRFGAQGLRDGGCIVLVSGAPARRPRPGQVALASVGASVEQLVRTVAPEFAARRVRINVVSPGMINTPMFGPVGDERSQKLQAATGANMIPRAGAADEVAHGIMFAVENQFISGTTIDVDGGWLSRM